MTAECELKTATAADCNAMCATSRSGEHLRFYVWREYERERRDRQTDRDRERTRDSERQRQQDCRETQEREKQCERGRQTD